MMSEQNYLFSIVEHKPGVPRDPFRTYGVGAWDGGGPNGFNNNIQMQRVPPGMFSWHDSNGGANMPSPRETDKRNSMIERLIHVAHRSLEDFVEEHNAEVLSSDHHPAHGRIHLLRFCPCCYGGATWTEDYEAARERRSEADIFVSPLGGRYADTGGLAYVRFREVFESLPRDADDPYRNHSLQWYHGWCRREGVREQEFPFTKEDLEAEKVYADAFISSVKNLLSEKGMYSR